MKWKDKSAFKLKNYIAFDPSIANIVADLDTLIYDIVHAIVDSVRHVKMIETKSNKNNQTNKQP